MSLALGSVAGRAAGDDVLVVLEGLVVGNGYGG